MPEPESTAWGKKPTQFFYDITPDKVLTAVESAGLVCTGRCIAMASMENRVYEVELDVESLDRKTLHTPSDRYRIAKFYRPGRWSEEQILEEHRFLLDLQEQEIPAIAPIVFEDGKTLKPVGDSGIWYALFPKVGGRSPDELSDEQLTRLGRLQARIHNVGGAREAKTRLHLNPQTYGLGHLDYLLQNRIVPPEHERKFEALVREICDLSAPWFAETKIQRIHGDCHFNNLLWNEKGPFFLDFDDMVNGPPVQDLWLMIPGVPSRDPEAKRQFEILLTAYEQMREFDHRSLRLIEPLRALRFVHFCAWMSKRWEDPAFPRAFPHYGTPKYWGELTQDLANQRDMITRLANV